MCLIKKYSDYNMLFMLILSERPMSVRTFLISLATNISIMGVVLSEILVILS